MTIMTREDRLDQLGDRVLAIREEAQRAKGYTQARCCYCGYSVPLAQFLYSGDTCPAYITETEWCDGKLVLVTK